VANAKMQKQIRHERLQTTNSMKKINKTRRLEILKRKMLVICRKIMKWVTKRKNRNWLFKIHKTRMTPSWMRSKNRISLA